LIALATLLGLASGAAAQCSPLPYTLTNGSNADATQVMANFNGILSCPLFTGALTVNASTDHVLNVRGDPASFGLPSSLLGPILQGVNTAQTLIEPITLFGTSVLLMGGNVGVGTTTPSSLLYVNGTAGGTSAWSPPSDRRLKTDIVPLAGALDLVMQLQPVRYRWRPVEEREVGRTLDLPVAEPQIGLIAQDVAKVLPSVVTPPASPDGVYGLKESSLVPVLVQAIKEQQLALEALRQEVSALKATRAAAIGQ
jgi:hypothetical protein